MENSTCRTRSCSKVVGRCIYNTCSCYSLRHSATSRIAAVLSSHCSVLKFPKILATLTKPSKDMCSYRCLFVFFFHTNFRRKLWKMYCECGTFYFPSANGIKAE
eukprot:Rmarinus@m.26139